MLSTRLINPTPAALREECSEVCKERYDTKDERMLRAVFGTNDSLDGYLRAIDMFGLGKFKSVITFLEGKTDPQKDKNIELVAWLIDFKHRPYQMNINYDALRQQNELNKVARKKEGPIEDVGGDIGEVSKGVEGESSTGEGQTLSRVNLVDEQQASDEGEQVGVDKSGEKAKSDSKEVKEAEILTFEKPNTETKEVLPEQPVSRRERLKNLIILLLAHKALKPALIMITVTIVVFYVSIGEHTEQLCMYWTGDHFQQISCNQKVAGAAVIAFDSQKMAEFRKLTSWDTVTEKSIGVLFYGRKKGKYELFTSYGLHPVDPSIILRPMTEYILKNQIRPRVQSDTGAQLVSSPSE